MIAIYEYIKKDLADKNINTPNEVISYLAANGALQYNEALKYVVKEEFAKCLHKGLKRMEAFSKVAADLGQPETRIQNIIYGKI